MQQLIKQQNEQQNNQPNELLIVELQNKLHKMSMQLAKVQHQQQHLLTIVSLTAQHNHHHGNIINKNVRRHLQLKKFKTYKSTIIINVVTIQTFFRKVQQMRQYRNIRSIFVRLQYLAVLRFKKKVRALKTIQRFLRWCLNLSRSQVKDKCKHHYRKRIKCLSEYNNIVDNYKCPILLDLPKSPVFCVKDGRIYDKESIFEWLKQNNTSPFTREKIFYTDFFEMFTKRTNFQSNDSYIQVDNKATWCFRPTVNKQSPLINFNTIQFHMEINDDLQLLFCHTACVDHLYHVITFNISIGYNKHYTCKIDKYKLLFGCNYNEQFVCSFEIMRRGLPFHKVGSWADFHPSKITNYSQKSTRKIRLLTIRQNASIKVDMTITPDEYDWGKTFLEDYQFDNSNCIVDER